MVKRNDKIRCFGVVMTPLSEIEKAFLFQRMPLMSPEMRKMRRNVVLQELFLHVRRRRVIGRVLAEELENLGGP